MPDNPDEIVFCQEELDGHICELRLGHDGRHECFTDEGEPCESWVSKRRSGGRK